MEDYRLIPLNDRKRFSRRSVLVKPAPGGVMVYIPTDRVYGGNEEADQDPIVSEED